MRTLKIISAALVVCAITLPVSAKSIGSWSDVEQQGGDLATPSTALRGYSALSQALTVRGHSLVAGTDTLTTSYLSSIDVFFWGVSSHILDTSEASALQAFVSAGGLLLVETDNDLNEIDSANSAANALDLGDIVSFGSSTSSPSILFTNSTTLSTDGPFGDVRGEGFTGTYYAQLNASAGTVVASGDGGPIMAEFAVPGSVVLFVADPLGFNYFQDPDDNTSDLYDADIQTAYINYIEAELEQDNGGDEVIPEPLTMVTLTGLLGSLGGYIRKRRNA